MLRVYSPSLFVLLLFVFAPADAQVVPESVPVLRASELLSEDLLEGPYHRVAEDVWSDGYLNYYKVDSDFGTFEVPSNLMLAVRVREFAALAELERVSKSSVFADAAIEAGLSPARAVVSFAKSPVDTVTGIPRGIGRMFKRYSRAGREGVSMASERASTLGEPGECEQLEDEIERADCEELEERRQRGSSLYARYFKVSDSERRWHAELGTDPYTSNDVLYEAVRSVAWADRLGRFSIKFAGIPSIPGAGYIADANKIVWSKDPYELRDYNRGVLREAGLDEAAIDEFFDNPWFSPSMETTLIAALESLNGVPGRKFTLVAATNTESEAEARFVLESLVAMTWYNAEVSPIRRFLDDDHFPIAESAEGRVVVILPVDYLFWTAEMAGLAGAVARQHPAELESGERELWLLGRASDLARQEITKLGWSVRENQAAVIRASGTRAAGATAP